jgi:hypothetical protein
VYAGQRDPREPAAVRALLDALTSGDPGPDLVRVTGQVPWRRRPALYREHALFVTASADQAREQLASGARVIMFGPEAGSGAVTDDGGWDLPALREKAGTLRGRAPLAMTEILPALREIFTAHATPARLAALGELAGLGDHLICGRRVAVLARADDAGAASALAADLARQRFLPAEVVVAAGARDAASAEIAARAVTAALGDLADRGVSVQAVPVVTGEAVTGRVVAGPVVAGRVVAGRVVAGESVAREAVAGQAVFGEAVSGEAAGWLRRAASAARSPWVAPWSAVGAQHESYLLDLVCARECTQADATGYDTTGHDGAGYDGAGYTFTRALDPGLARREYFASGDPGPGLRLVSVSAPAKEDQR